METFFIIIISILVTLGLVTIYKQWKTEKLTNAQSILLLDKIKRVCKFITVEGDFAENAKRRARKMGSFMYLKIFEARLKH